MTYKWEAIAQDLTEERDRLLKENALLKAAHELGWAKRDCPVCGASVAVAALKSEKQ